MRVWREVEIRVSHNGFAKRESTSDTSFRFPIPTIVRVSDNAAMSPGILGLRGRPDKPYHLHCCTTINGHHTSSNNGCRK